MNDQTSRPFLYKIRADANVTVTKNPNSAFREPTDAEITPYGRELVKMALATRSQLSQSVSNKGWHISNTTVELTIDERTK